MKKIARGWQPLFCHPLKSIADMKIYEMSLEMERMIYRIFPV
jgi:hypothetical protein